MQDVTNGTLGVRRGALEYQVPCLTLSNRVTGRVCPGAAPGPPKYLCKEEEEELVKWIAGYAEVGYAKGVCEIRAVVGAIVSHKLSLDTPIVVSLLYDDTPPSRICRFSLVAMAPSRYL